MCGLAGLTLPPGSRPAPEARAEVSLMLQTLAHRGPDGSGLAALDGIVLGHRRLAIIDRSERSAQPMRLRCAQGAPEVWIVCNGEIYNHVELRAELEARGHRFHSDGDTEVILHLYEERKEGCAIPLRGMFAFALWDAPARRLLLARDRLGKKPLYYREMGGAIAFASEIKALLALSRARGEPIDVDADAVRSYLALKYVPGPGTAVRGIRRLPPGHLMLREGGRSALRPYWQLPEARASLEPGDEGPLAADDDRVALAQRREMEALVEAIRESVRIRMRSDVPLGLFLSGGLDSGIIAALMARHATATGASLRTFTVSFDRADYDELAAARSMARALGTRHEEIALRLTPAGTVDRLSDLAWHLDQPFADSSAVAVHHLAREVRRHVTVALSGDGGDEVFLGYDRYRAHRLADRCGGALTRWAARVGSPLVRAVPLAPAGRRNLKGRALRFLDACALPRAARNDAWVTCYDGPLAAAVLTPDFRRATAAHEPLGRLHEAYGRDGGGTIESIQRADLLVYLPDDILHKADLASMMHGLEMRAPLLDHLVVERAMKIPTALKLGPEGPGKRVLRRAFEGIDPAPALAGRKAGFGIPLDHWLRSELHGWCRDVLLDPASLGRGIVTRVGVETLLAEHRAGKANREDALWALVMLEHWYRAVHDADRYPAASRMETVAG